MGFLIGRATLMVQAFELRAIGGERPASVGRKAGNQRSSGSVEPDGHAVGVDRRAVGRIDECAAAGRDDEMPRRQLFEEHGALRPP